MVRAWGANERSGIREEMSKVMTMKRQHTIRILRMGFLGNGGIKGWKGSIYQHPWRLAETKVCCVFENPGGSSVHIFSGGVAAAAVLLWESKKKQKGVGLFFSLFQTIGFAREAKVKPTLF
jgi:hypothetical protein